MSGLSWLYHCIILGLEVFLLNKFYCGIILRERNIISIFAVLTVGISSYFLRFVPMVEVDYDIIWATVLLFVVFELKWFQLLKQSFLSLLIINIWNGFIWGISLLFVSDIKVINSEKLDLLCGTISFLLFIVLTIVLQIKKLLPLSFWEDLSPKQSILLIIGLLLVEFFLAAMYGFLVGEMTPKLARYAVVCCILTVVFIAFIFFYLILTIQKKNYLEQVHQLEAKYLRSQQKHYERTINQFEELRKFRHDIKHHFFVLGHLASEKRLDEIQKYIEDLQESSAATSVSYTGHSLIDALIYDIFQEHFKSKDIVFSFRGKMPPSFAMDNSDLCILFANAFQNACEELERQENDRKFEMEIRGNDTEIFVVIRNTLKNFETLSASVEKNVHSQRKVLFFDTEKPDRRNHGFGTQNMKKVAEKCGIDLEWWIVDERWMEIRMGFPKNK